MLTAGFLFAALAVAAEPPAVRPPSDKTYRVLYLPAAALLIDGKADEPLWAKANVERGFRFPWKRAEAPATEFRALCDEKFLYFAFRVHDDDIVVLDRLRDEEDAVFEDRAEMYFARDPQMRDYFNVEIDSRGRPFDYRGRFYRQLDAKFAFDGLKTKGAAIERGYQVEGRIPTATFASLGFPRLAPGAKILCGLYRAEFSHDRSGRKVEQKETIHNRGRKLPGPPPLEDWMSWIDPATPEPDFHVPSSLGWLEIVAEQ